MTGYYLEVGYNSAFDRDDAWARLKAVALDICEHPERIADEVLRIEPSVGRTLLTEYALAYVHRIDLTIKFHEAPTIPTEEPFRPYIAQLASGGGDGRDIKEACRRAFCRLVIEAMHRERIEVNLKVV